VPPGGRRDQAYVTISSKRVAVGCRDPLLRGSPRRVDLASPIAEGEDVCDPLRVLTLEHTRALVRVGNSVPTEPNDS
jgi:hypothetical protein